MNCHAYPAPARRPIVGDPLTCCPFYSGEERCAQSIARSVEPAGDGVTKRASLRNLSLTMLVLALIVTKAPA